MKTTDQFKYSEWMVDGRHEMLADTLIALWDGMDLLLILHQQSLSPVPVIRQFSVIKHACEEQIFKSKS